MARRIYKRDSHGRFARTGQSAKSRRRRNQRLRVAGGVAVGVLAGVAASRTSPQTVISGAIKANRGVIIASRRARGYKDPDFASSWADF